MDRQRLARWIRWGTLFLMVLFAVFWLLFGVGEMASGDLSGVIHLIPVALVAGLMFLAWRRPGVGGAILVVLGILTSAYYYGLIQPEDRLGILLITGAPFVLFGLLFLAVAALARPALRGG
jgi:hypothetical protein